MKTGLKNIMVLLIETICASYLFYNDSEPLKNTIAFILVFSIFMIVSTKYHYKKNMWDMIPPALFAIFMVLGESFKLSDSWDLAIGGLKTNILSIIKLFGWFFIFNKLIAAVKLLGKKVYNYNFNLSNNRLNQINNFIMNKHPFIMPFIIMYICWIPYIIIKYPGSWNFDSLWQINMAFGYRPWTTHHPPVSTLLIGGIVWLFAKIKDPNFGLFVYILIQSAFLAGVMAFSILKMGEMKIKNVYRWCMLVIFALLPVFPSYATSAYKDVWYCCFMLLYMFYLYRFAANEKVSVRNLICIAVWSLLVILFRSNGIYVVLPTAIAAVIIKLRTGFKSWAKALVILMLPVIAGTLTHSFCVKGLGFNGGNPAEAWSILVQQTGRLIRDYPEDVTEEDKANIDGIFDYETFATKYDPNLSDDLKGTYKGGTAQMHLNYLKTWLKGLKQHPHAYIQATMNTCYPAFYPDVNNSIYWVNSGSYPNMDRPPLNQNKPFKSVRDKLERLLTKLDSVPVIGALSNPALYVWLLILFICDILKKKQYKLIVTVIPMVMTVAIIIAGPCVFLHPRYVYPIMWPMYLYTACMILYHKNLKNRKSI
ncbi:MAG: DUF6020 family protein [Candidatus Ornithomonoglobus sp.]